MGDYVVTVGFDGGASEAADVLGDSDLFRVHSFSTRHRAFSDPDRLLGCSFEYPEVVDSKTGLVEEYGQTCGFMPTNHPADHPWEGPAGFLLSYFEHGLCRWGLAGSMAGTADFRWDGVEYAGFLEVVAAGDLLEWWEGHGFEERERVAADYLGRYTEWCNGEVYWFELERVPAARVCDLGYRHQPRVSLEGGSGGVLGSELVGTIADVLAWESDRVDSLAFEGEGADYLEVSDVLEVLESIRAGGEVVR